jgi:putative endonuclease
MSGNDHHNLWTLYILRCADNTLYTGITNNLERRIEEHNGRGKAAKYTRGRQPVTLVYQENCDSRSAATKREILIKKLSKADKEALVSP